MWAIIWQPHLNTFFDIVGFIDNIEKVLFMWIFAFLCHDTKKSNKSKACLQNDFLQFLRRMNYPRWQSHHGSLAVPIIISLITVISCHLSTAPIHNSPTLNCTKILLRPSNTSANRVIITYSCAVYLGLAPNNFRCKTMGMISGVGLKLRVQRVTRFWLMYYAHIHCRDNSVTGDRSWTVVLQELLW